jgi:nucleotide-binding universal stress UspA family protein
VNGQEAGGIRATPGRARPPVVVGIDAAGSAGAAVEWAAAESATCGCALRIVHVFRPSVPADPYGVVAPMDTYLAARAAADAVLAESVERARTVASDIEVSAHLLGGTTLGSLLAEAARARLLVLGSRGLCGLRALLARSVSAQVAAHACGPVVVVPPAAEGPRPAWSPPRVVVGVGSGGSSAPAIGFAFRAARQRGIPLVAVHAWTPDVPADLEAVHAPASVAEVVGRRTLERALQPWRASFPDVEVVVELVRGEPARIVGARSRGAALVVVGSRHRGHVRAAVLGSVSRSVLQHGGSPVAVVGDVGRDPAPPSPSRGAPQGNRAAPSWVRATGSVLREARDAFGRRASP